MAGVAVSDFISENTSWFVGSERQHKRVDQAKEHLLFSLREDLESAVALYRQLREQWAEHDDVDLTVLANLKKVSTIPDSNSEWMHEFVRRGLQDDIEVYYQQVNKSVDEITLLKSQTLAIEKMFKQLLLDLMEKEPQLSIDDALERMKSLNEREAIRYKNLFKQLGRSVMELCDTEIRASEFLAQLSNSAA